MNPKQFLQYGGAVLVVVGILGFFLIGPTADESVFGASWWFDNGENYAHLIIGIVGLIAASMLSASSQKSLVMLLGVVGILVGVYSIVIGTIFFGSNLENPADSILHLVVGGWALWASMKKQGMMSM